MGVGRILKSRQTSNSNALNYAFSKKNGVAWKELKIQSRNPRVSLAHFEQKSVLRTIRASEEAYFGRRPLFLSQANPQVCQLVLGTKASAGEPPANLITARGLLQLQQSGKKHNPAAEQGIISLCAEVLPRVTSAFIATISFANFTSSFITPSLPLYNPSTAAAAAPYLFFYIHTRQKPTSIIALQYNVIKLLERAETTRRRRPLSLSLSLLSASRPAIEIPHRARINKYSAPMRYIFTHFYGFLLWLLLRDTQFHSGASLNDNKRVSRVNFVEPTRAYMRRSSESLPSPATLYMYIAERFVGSVCRNVHVCVGKRHNCRTAVTAVDGINK
jgi:hypothetical protein